jgi:hypothetical protein
VREVLPDGSLGPIQQKPKPGAPREAAPAGISKFSGFSREQLLQKILDVRERKVFLEKKRDAIPGKSIKLPHEEKLQLRQHLQELQELNQHLEKLDTAAVGQHAPISIAVEGDDEERDQHAGAADEAVEFSSSDDEGGDIEE